MERLKNEKVSRMLLIACFAAYAITTTVKMCVPTVISSMVSEGFLNKSQSGLLSGIFYLVYGIGQLTFGKYFNTHSPFRGVKIAVIGSALCCVMMSLTDNFYLLLIFWSLCALVNSCFFPAIMKIVSYMLSVKHSVWANKYLMIAYQGGTVLCLVAGSIIIQFVGWVNLYYFAAVICVVTAVYWYVAEHKAKRCLYVSDTVIAGKKIIKPQEENVIKKPLRDYIGSGIFCMFAISFFNALLTGVKTWAPTIIMETYNTTPGFSVLLNVVIVVTNIVFLLVIGRYTPRNKVKSVTIFYLATLPIIILMNFTSLLNEYTYVLLLGIFTSVSTYVSNVTAIQMPYYFDRYNDVSRMSGIANMCASFGLLVGNYAYGILADSFGWEIIMILCVIYVVISILLSWVAIPRFKRFMR